MFNNYKLTTHKYKNALPIVMLSFITMGTIDAGNDNIYRGLQYGKDGKWPKIERTTMQGSFSSSFKSFKVQSKDVEKELLNWFNLSDKSGFVKISESVDNNDISHIKYQQYYKGLPLSGKVIMVHSKGGTVLSINGQVGADLSIDIVASITAEEAIDYAKNAFNIVESVNIYTPQLVVYSKIEGEEVKEILAYEFRIDSFKPFFMKNVWVDAKTGDILNSVSLIANADVKGTGTTYYYGNQSIAVEQFSGGYRLRDNSRNIETFDAKDVAISYDKVKKEILFLNKADIVSSTTHFSLNAAIDAHWGMEKTYDYYKDTFNRLSFDGQNSKITSYYNPGDDFIDALIGPSGGFPNNAVAMPFPFNFMAFGTGDGVNYDPVVGIDVAGHEYTHLVMNNNGSDGLKYQGESGALNESFADIFGTSIENYAIGTDSNWLIGEGIILKGANDFMRSMQDPKVKGYPNTYKGKYWVDTANIGYDNGGVHINSSVQNYWFYLLVEGGSGTNDLNNDYVVNGIGRAKAEKIAYHNMMDYLNYNSGFLDAYDGSLQFAEDFYGLDSAEYNEVKNAWYAVGIGEGGNLSIGEFEVESKLRVYPNPVVDGIIKVSTDNVNPITVELFNIMGKRVYVEQLYQGENSIDVNSLTNGVYLLVFNVDGKTHTEKIIINQ